MRVYLAGGIFFYADYLRNKEWSEKIRKEIPNIDLYSPVENTDINGIEGKKKFASSKMVAEADNLRLDNTDVLIACIDGDVIPSGTSTEIGRFSEKISRGDHKYLIGICTDTRQMALTYSEEKVEGGRRELGDNQFSYQNIYTTGVIKQCGPLVSTIEEVIDFLKEKQNEFDVIYEGEIYNDL